MNMEETILRTSNNQYYVSKRKFITLSLHEGWKSYVFFKTRAPVLFEYRAGYVITPGRSIEHVVENMCRSCEAIVFEPHEATSNGSNFYTFM